MAFITDPESASLKIAKAIFHAVGPDEADFVPLDVAFDPGANSEFFLDRVRATARGATCDFLDDSEVVAALLRLEEDETRFVPESRELARRFAAAHSANAKKGVFFLFLLSSSSGTLHAMLKLDHEEVLAYALVQNEGVTSASITRLVNTFVKNPSALQKGAVVRLRAEMRELCVHDHASKRGITQYFEQFLGSRRRFTPAALTQKAVDIARKAASQHRDELPADVQLNVVSRILGAARSEAAFGPGQTAFVSAAFGALPEDSPILKAFDKGLRDGGIEDEAFILDASALKPSSRRILRTKEGIEITYSAHDQDRIHRRELEDGSFEITVQTAEITRDDVEPD